MSHVFFCGVLDPVCPFPLNFYVGSCFLGFCLETNSQAHETLVVFFIVMSFVAHLDYSTNFFTLVECLLL